MKKTAVVTEEDLPKVSVIIPTYNRGSLLLRSVTSVFFQTYKNFEVVVVDDGSVDNSIAELREHIADSRLVIFELQKNQGVHIARNKGIDICTGQFIVFLDSDDTLDSDALSTFVRTSQNEKADWISAPYRLSDGELTGIETDTSGWISKKEIFSGERTRALKPGLGFIKKERIADIRFVAPNLDFIFYRRLTRNAEFFYYAKPLGTYYREENANSLHVKRKKPNISLSIKRGKALDAFLYDFKKDCVLYCPDLLSGYSYGASVGLLLDGVQTKAIKRGFDAMYYSKFSLQYVLFFLFTLIPCSPYLLRFSFLLKKFFLGLSSEIPKKDTV